MPAPLRCLLVAAAALLAWRLGQGGAAAAVFVILGLGVSCEARLTGRLARLARRQPERGDLPTAAAMRWHPWLVGGAAAVLAVLSHRALLGEGVPLAVVANLLAVCYPALSGALHELAWPEVALVTGRAWRHRQRPEALAALVRSHTLVLPKSGVLTLGHPRLAGVHPLREGVHTAELLAVAAGLLAEDRSPAAEAVRQGLYATGLLPVPIEKPEPLPGLGVRGVALGHTWSLGTRPLAAQLGHRLDAAAEAMLACQVAGGSAWVLLDEAGPVGWLELRDAPRPAAATLLENLRLGGVRRLVLVSDDEPAAAERLRRWFDADEVLPRQAPARLAELIRAWSADGPVAVVGRPRTDPVALAAADVPVTLVAADEDPVGGLWLHESAVTRLAAPHLALRGARRRSRRLQRRLLPGTILVLALACVGAPLPLVVLLDEALLLLLLVAVAARTAPPGGA